jgi:hypothetical protein
VAENWRTIVLVFAAVLACWKNTSPPRSAPARWRCRGQPRSALRRGCAALATGQRNATFCKSFLAYVNAEKTMFRQFCQSVGTDEPVNLWKKTT